MSTTSLFFSVVYNFLYYLLYLVLIAFIIVTPSDLIQQAIPRRSNYDILIITLCYIVTILSVIFIYASRLYIIRSVLASIPKPWIPIDKGDVPHDVHAMISEDLSRSAAIAYESRPRVPPVVPMQRPAVDPGGENLAASSKSATSPPWLSKLRKSHESDRDLLVDLAQRKPVWGEIEHPGWASPTSPDLPNLQYDTVVLELPNLIEAKALTLAPPDPESNVEPPVLNPDAVALLQRPESMGLRDYLMHLTDLAVLAPLPTTSEFLAKYEAARFSARPLTNDQFRTLMHLFAEILRNMHPLSHAALVRYQGDEDDASSRSPSESDIDNDAPRGTSPSSFGTAARDMRTTGGNANDAGSFARRGSSSTESSGRLRPGIGARHSSANTWQYRTAPTTPRSRHTGLSRQSSSASFAQTKQPYPAGRTSSSASSLRSVGEGSVIRLAGANDATDLPYVLTYSPSQ